MADLRGGTTIGGNIAWHSGNMGAGSRLDADSVHGILGTDLLKKDGSVAMTYLTVGSRLGVIGTNSVSEGYNTTASNYYSHAEGSATTASGEQSHAEGFYTMASGNSSHAEGGETIASGSRSHAEGAGTVAGSTGTVTVYSDTTAGFFSHAEGNATKASGNSSHAEGKSTTASGNYSHAEGNNTTASGNSSHAEGLFSESLGDYSHAEGLQTYTNGNYSHSEGQNSSADGVASHSEGYYTTASGNYSHAEGDSTTAFGISSHVQNVYTVAQGHGQTAIGRYNVLQGTPNSYVTTDQAFIIGNGTSDVNRSNALTVDWSGNTVISGSLKINSTTIINSSGQINASQLLTGTVPGDRGVTVGSASSSFIEYNGTTATAGQFDGGTTAPSGTTRLNYGGYLYATKLYSGGTEAEVKGHTHAALTAGNGITGTAYNGSTAYTWSIASHAGTAGSIGTINIGADTVGVNLGTTSTTAYRGDYGNTAYSHVTSDGSSHSYIDQSVTTTASPTFVAVHTSAISVTGTGEIWFE